MSKLLEKINALKAHRDTVLAPLEAKSDQWTAEDRKAYEEGISKAEAFQKDITLLEKSSGIDAFMASGAAAQVAKEAAGGNAPDFQIDGKDSTALLTPKGAEADKPELSSKTLGMTMEADYKRAFKNFLRTSGNVDSADLKVLSNVHSKAMQEGLDPSGGVLVPADIVAEIIRRDKGLTSLAGQVRTIQTGRDKINLPRFEYDTDDIYSSSLDFQWEGENGEAAEDTSLEDWGSKEISIYTGMFQVEFTRDLLEDAFVDVESWAREMIGEAYDMRLENLMINGSGIGRPRGILSEVGGTKRIAGINVGNPMTDDGLIDLYFGLPAQYREGATFLASGTVLAAVAKLEDGAGQKSGLIGDLNMGGLASARQLGILGKPISESALMPASGAANNILAFGNWKKAYAHVMRVGMTIEPYGQTDKSMLRANRRGFHVRTRFGGDVLQGRAAKIGVQS